MLLGSCQVTPALVWQTPLESAEHTEAVHSLCLLRPDRRPACPNHHALQCSMLSCSRQFDSDISECRPLFLDRSNIGSV